VLVVVCVCKCGRSHDFEPKQRHPDIEWLYSRSSTWNSPSRNVLWLLQTTERTVCNEPKITSRVTNASTLIASSYCPFNRALVLPACWKLSPPSHCPLSPSSLLHIHMPWSPVRSLHRRLSIIREVKIWLMSKENIFANLVGRNFMESGLLVEDGEVEGIFYGVLWYGRCSDFGCCYHTVKCDSAI
jgi:hypothetical protein